MLPRITARHSTCLGDGAGARVGHRQRQTDSVGRPTRDRRDLINAEDVEGLSGRRCVRLPRGGCSVRSQHFRMQQGQSLAQLLPDEAPLDRFRSRTCSYTGRSVPIGRAPEERRQPPGRTMIPCGHV
jgi:hypothetical protein